MNRLIYLALTLFILNVGHAIAEDPASSCFHSSLGRANLALINDTAVVSELGRANLALINDTAVVSEKQLVLKQPDGPAVTYQTKRDAGDVANMIMIRMARRKEVRNVMLTIHEKTLIVTGDIQTQKIVLEIVAEIENSHRLEH